MENTPWYSLNIKDTLRNLNTDPEGISSREAFLRLKKFGLNEFGEKKKKNEFYKFFSQFKNPLVYLLILSALITYFLKHNLDTVIIIVIVLLNTIIGYFQEKKAEKSLEALKKLMSLRSRVIRDGNKMEISALELVPGDIVTLEEGSKIPADIRLIESTALKLDESILTGESTPVYKNTEIIKKDALISDQKNMLFSGTIVVSGKGTGVVVATGKNTQFAKIAKEISELPEESTPLEKKLEKFSKILLVVIIWVAVVIFVIGLFRGFNAINMLLTAVAAAVAIIPEGLPAVITVTMAVGIHTMAKQNAIVKKLSAVETLGQITTIASDKTGTLTYNQMTLEKIFIGDTEINITGEGYEPEGSFLISGKKINPLYQTELRNTLIISALCNNASLVEEKKEWKIIGDPTEGALLVASEKAGIYQEEIIRKYPRLDEISFDAKMQFMATLHRDKNKSDNLIAVKGTLEKILSLAKYIHRHNMVEKLDIDTKKNILKLADQEARQGYRILALAEKHLPDHNEKISTDDIRNLIFLGFSAIKDPPREEVKDAIAKCQTAGIKVVMITGDFPATAKAIADNLGIDGKNTAVITGEELSLMPIKEFRETVRNTSIFARVTPEGKLKIVESLQKNNQIVAVTGDGVNDAPILKQADIGISMGIGGTDVAREASDMVLLDNNFSTITNAIEEGRTIYQNIKRAIFFLISTNAGEILILMSAIVIGLPIPLSPIQILWINLITDGVSGFSLAMEPKHSEILKLKPRSPKEGILNKIISLRIAIVAVTMTIGTMILYYFEILNGASENHARTIAFVSMAFFQIFNILNSRSFKTSIFNTPLFSNVYITFSVISMIILTVLTAQLPFFQRLFDTVGLTFNEWIYVVMVSLSVIIVVEIEKFVRNLLKSEY